MGKADREKVEGLYDWNSNVKTLIKVYESFII